MLRKKVLAVVIGVLIMILLCSVSQASSGTSGSISWTFENGTMTISGEGEIPKSFISTLWSEAAGWIGTSSIIELHIEEGITGIGNYAFKSCNQMTTVSVPSTLTKIGYAAFE